MGVKISVLVLLALFYNQNVEARRPTRIGFMSSELIFKDNQDEVDHEELNREMEKEQELFFAQLEGIIYNHFDDYEPSNDERACSRTILEKVVSRLANSSITSLQSDEQAYASIHGFAFETAYHFSRTSRTVINRTVVARNHLDDNANIMTANDKVAYMKMIVENVRQKIQELRDTLGKDDPTHLLSELLRGSIERPLPSMSNCTADIVFRLNCAEELFNRTFRGDYNTLMNSLEKYENHEALKENFTLPSNGHEAHRLFKVFEKLMNKLQDDLVFNKGADYIKTFGSTFFGDVASRVANKLSGTDVHYDYPKKKWCYYVRARAASFQN